MNNTLLIFFAEFLIYFLFLGLGVLWFIDGKIKKEQVLHAFLSCLFAWAIALAIKFLFPVARPYLENGSTSLALFAPTGSSFPSEHTTLAFALAVTIFMHDRVVGWGFLIGAILVGMARVLANVHYPLDILGGAFLGTIVSIILERIHFVKLLSPKSSRGRKK